ncbi:MAG: class I SAM-dependent methyltransferase [Bacteroidia bacterium]|nr:class I SAM-dependent methyltransferase [Bacteroidia bacterium]
MNAKKHYDSHLARIYSWMAGDFNARTVEFCSFLESQHIKPVSSKIAIDLGAGDGAQSSALAKGGYSVKALDFNHDLLEELKKNCKDEDVTAYEDDLMSIGKFAKQNPELILCWGDTLTHLDTQGRIESFIEQCADTLAPGGKLILSFRDYSEKIVGDKRFIPVKSDSNRILTCFVDYLPTHVMVTDIIHELQDGKWQQKVSSYTKVRISEEEVLEILQNNNLKIFSQNTLKGMVAIVAEK